MAQIREVLEALGVILMILPVAAVVNWGLLILLPYPIYAGVIAACGVITFGTVAWIWIELGRQGQ